MLQSVQLLKWYYATRQTANLWHEIIIIIIIIAGRENVVGIATCYGLNDPGIESRWGRYFPHPFRPALGPTQPPVQLVLGLFRGGGSGPGRGVDHPRASSAEVKERVELYLHSPSGPS
jgi:hypothetical protein